MPTGDTQKKEGRFTCILFPTDFSATAEHALAYALSLAKEYGAQLFLLHVIDESSEASGFYVPHMNYDKLESDMKVAAEKMLKSFCITHLKGVEEYSSDVVAGIPYKEIIAAADKRQADLIVMGSHGRTGIDRLVFGSTTERVLRKSPCPVLTVHPSEETPRSSTT